MVNVNDSEILPEQVLQNSAPVIVETPNDNEEEYIGPTLHFRLPPRATQPTVQNLNQGVQIHPPHLGEPSVVAPPFLYPGHPMLHIRISMVRLSVRWWILDWCILKGILSLLLLQLLLRQLFRVFNLLVIKLILILPIRLWLVQIKIDKQTISC